MKKHALILLAPLFLGFGHGPGASLAEAREAREVPEEALVSAEPDLASVSPGAEVSGAEAAGEALVSGEGPRLDRMVAPVPALADDPPGEERSSAPTDVEWRAAPEVTLSRSLAACHAKRAREWLRIACALDPELAAVDLLAGPREGVSFHAGRGGEVAVVLPVRRGDRRIFQAVRVASQSRYSLDYDAELVISEEWLPGAPAPTVVAD